MRRITTTMIVMLVLVAGRTAHGQDSLNMSLLWSTLGFSEKVSVQDDRAYVAGGRLRIWDIADRSAPELLGEYQSMSMLDVVVQGNYAYVAQNYNGMRVIDISNPAGPQSVSELDLPGQSFAIEIEGNFAYIAALNAGLRIVDISDPYNPEEVGYFDDVGIGAYEVKVRSNLAFVPWSDAGLRIIDVSNPTSPQLVGIVDTPVLATDVAVTGDFAYVADASGGVRIINVTNPAAPIEAHSFGYGQSHVTGIAVYENHLYVADFLSGLVAVDITTPTQPMGLGYYTAEYLCSHLSIDGCEAFVCGQNTLFFGIFDVSQIEGCATQAETHPMFVESLDLSQNYPNPFNPETTIEFTLSTSGQTKLTVFDLLGREVATLVDETLSAGRHSYHFSANPGLASGVYIYRLSTPNSTETKKMILLR